MIFIGKKHNFGLLQFREILLKNRLIELCPDAIDDLKKTRNFIDFLVENNIEIYGVTTGLADLRDQKINSSLAAQLREENLIYLYNDLSLILNAFQDVIIYPALLKGLMPRVNFATTASIISCPSCSFF